ncbi:MAG: response regulator [Brachymonas sp.]|nr:response regulator [Brachymonas sp.]
MPVKHVLIVDDSKTEQMFMSSIMQKNGMTVSVADDGNAAMAELERKKPDLILMDVIMPGKNGFQLTRQISKDARFADIPIIICTSKNQEVDIVWGLRQGARAYVTKPINPAELLEKIQELD